jgi:hypothetical protein
MVVKREKCGENGPFRVVGMKGGKGQAKQASFLSQFYVQHTTLFTCPTFGKIVTSAKLSNIFLPLLLTGPIPENCLLCFKFFRKQEKIWKKQIAVIIIRFNKRKLIFKAKFLCFSNHNCILDFYTLRNCAKTKCCLV